MKVLLLAAAADDLADNDYPRCLVELDGIPLIETLISKCQTIDGAQILVVLRTIDIARFHLDDVVRLLNPGSKVIAARRETGGATCSALLAIGDIDSEDELLIVNANELVDVNFSDEIEKFRNRGLSAGTLTFASVHPRYSYVRSGDDGLVLEAAEKRPISRTATVGFYWFRRGHDFVEAAMDLIRNDDSVDGRFFISHTLNHLILRGLDVGHSPIPSDKYHPLKSEQQINQYESLIAKGR